VPTDLHLTRSSAAVQPNFWLDPKMGITYAVAVQTSRSYRAWNSINALPEYSNSHPYDKQSQPKVLGNMATLSPAVQPVVVNHPQRAAGLRYLREYAG